MTSLINPSNIDITFPIAGQDNDTQGFRTNYQNIRNNFIIAASEISALQNNTTYTANLTVQGNLITTTITTPASSSANLVIDPDSNADVIINSNNLWLNAGNLRSTASTFTIANLYPTTGYILGNASAIYMAASSSNVTLGGNLKVNNSITVNNGLYSINNFNGSYTDGIVVDYVSTNGRISVGTADNLTFYAGGPANTQTLTIASNAVVSLSSAIQFANLTTTQVNAIATPARGMTVYNYTTGNIQVYNGTKWANVTLS
jgi:hypothetical protein